MVARAELSNTAEVTMRNYLKSVVVWPLLALSACAPSADGDDPSAANALTVEEVGLEVEPLVDPPGPIDTVTLNITADTSVRASATNKNFGSANTIDINRALLVVEQTTLKAAMPNSDFIESAKLKLTLVPTVLPRLPRNLLAHRVLKAWTEGGATWNCAIDSNVGNSAADCSGITKWSSAGGEFVSQATGQVTLPTSRSGTVEIDVTADVRKFKNDLTVKNYGWLLKTGVGNGGEVADIVSREGATKPQLVLKIRRCGGAATCDDGIVCSQEGPGFSCDDGICQRGNAAPVAPCDDGNPCTVADHCSGTSFDCVPGTPVAAGTPCGEGKTCSTTGACL
jgi:hypothetical protein